MTLRIGVYQWLIGPASQAALLKAKDGLAFEVRHWADPLALGADRVHPRSIGVMRDDDGERDAMHRLLYAEQDNTYRASMSPEDLRGMERAERRAEYEAAAKTIRGRDDARFFWLRNVLPEGDCEGDFYAEVAERRTENVMAALFASFPLGRVIVAYPVAMEGSMLVSRLGALGNAVALHREDDGLVAALVRAGECERVRLRTMPYTDYLATPHWQRTRAAMLGRQRECQRCGSIRRLQVHHKTYEHRGAEPFEDLEVLCRPCHEAEHGIRGAA